MNTAILSVSVLCAIAMLAGILCLTAAAQADPIYTYDNLNAGFLKGQDNWKDWAPARRFQQHQPNRRHRNGLRHDPGGRRSRGRIQWLYCRWHHGAKATPTTPSPRTWELKRTPQWN